MTKVANLLTNERFYNFGKTAAGAVYATTVLKAVGRPAFIYADKKSDAETKKYTAGKEFLYQVLCLGITVAMLPFFKMGGLKLAQKHLKELPEFADKKLGFKTLKNFEKEVLDATLHNKKGYSKDQIHAIKLANGGVEIGAFVGSILGLTIIAPMVSHKILHPIMKAIGFEKKHDEKPTIASIEKQPFLDKTEKTKLNTQV